MNGFATWLERHNFSNSTIRNYTRRIADLQTWLEEHHRPAAPRCSWRDIRSYANALPHTYATRSGFRSALAAYWRYLGKREAPTWAVPQPRRPDSRYRGLASKEEMYGLLEAARTLGPQPYTACCAMYFQGLRREETARIRWSDIRGSQLIGVGKGSREFSQPLHPRFAEALETLMPSGPWLFEGRTPGTHVSPVTIWMWVRLAGATAGLGRVTPHQLRHTSIATVYEATELGVAQDHARHRDPSVTRIYTRKNTDRLVEGMMAL